MYVWYLEPMSKSQEEAYALVDVFDEAIHVDEPGARVLVAPVITHRHQHLTRRVDRRLCSDT